MVDETHKIRKEIELRTSQIRYRRVFESEKEGILILDLATRKITDANPFIAELLGYRRDELMGRELWEIGLLSDAGSVQEAFRELKDSGFIRYEDLPLQTRDGLRREVEFVGNVYLEESHQVIQCNIRDITLRKEEQLGLRKVSSELSATIAELRRRDAEMSALNRMHEVLQACVTQEEAYKVIASFARELFPRQSGWLAAFHASRGKLEQSAAWGHTESMAPIFSPQDCWALRRNHLHEVPDPQVGMLCRHFVHRPEKGYVCVPLTVRDEMLGILCLLGTDDWAGEYQTNKVRLAVAVGEAIKMSLSKLSLQEKLREQAIRDPVTVLPNRRYLVKEFRQQLRLAPGSASALEWKSAGEALSFEKDRAQTTLNSIGDGVISTDLSGNITYLNRAAEQLTGWSWHEAIGQPFSLVCRIIDEVTRLPYGNPMESAIRQDKRAGLTAKCSLVRRDGVETGIEDSVAPIYDRQGRVTGAVLVFHDVSTERAMILRMSHFAEHDFLTNLPNRMLMKDRITQAISQADRHGAIQLAVLFLDLDGFKRINDSLGHTVGDKLLQSVAARLVTCVRHSDTVGRQGGDEFVILLSEIKHTEDAAISATKIISDMEAPHSIDEHELYISASIGLATYPLDGKDAEVLLTAAATAMSYAKQGGRNQYHCFSKAMNVRAVERQSLEGKLRRALARGEFLLYFQPKIDLKTGAITGSEALIRWLHPDRGLVPSQDFIPIAEDCGLILPIGQWVLRQACRQARAWLDAGLQVMPMAVNVSGVEFRSKDFLEGIRNILKEIRLEPSLLELELTESVLMQHAAASGYLLKALKDMGVRLAIDDFGTGYSSLSYLKQFPIDTLKVDQSFVKEIPFDTGDAAIVSAVISMAKSLGQVVIAEGVETAEQLAFLRERGCNEGQGYYFSRPVEAQQFATLLAGGIDRTAS